MQSLAVVLAGLAGVLALGARPSKYQTTRQIREGMLNVHLVPHTHDDVGWLKTVDEYYMGLNDSIQVAAVQYTLDTSTEQLLENPDRTFLYIEQAFFQRWWNEQDSDTQNSWKNLVATGQVEFGNGGWCMHDEAAAHWTQMVDNTYWGHKFIMDEFGVQPRIGWQIDPFGHSSTQAWLLSAEAGFDALYFGRIDFEDHDQRVNTSTLQMVWRASQSLGAEAQVFTGAFHSGNYGPPPGLCFDIFCQDGQVQDDTRLEDYNVDYYVNLFINAAVSMYNTSAQSGHIMFKMGSDFQYRNAREWYKNLDKLIHYVNLQSDKTGIHALYSTPTQYTVATNAANLSWTVKTDDFFPYRDNPHGAWTGYFTSRPGLKGFIRYGGNYLRGASLMDAALGGDGSTIETLWNAVGVTEHHDSVTGTAKQHVTYDYNKRIAAGVTTAAASMASYLASQTGAAASSFGYCPRVNESVCDTTQSASGGFDVTVFNWLAHSRSEPIRVPLPNSWTGVQVQAPNGTVVPSTVVSNMAVYGVADGSLRSVVFYADMAPAGFATYAVKQTSSASLLGESKMHRAVPPVVSNGQIAVSFDTTTGAITGLQNLVSGVNTSITQEWLWYNSSAGGVTDGRPWGNTGHGPNSYGQNSGAYIFRPNSSTPFPVNAAAANAATPIKVTVKSGPTVTEVQQTFADWLTQTVRVYANADYVEVEATVGPIPIDDAQGKEVITRFSTDINSGDQYYTDSNGREFLLRRRNYRPTYNLTLYGETVTNNYYPCAAGIRVADSTRDFVVLTDRAQAGASLASGQMELMPHRRLLWDDSRGVGEPLNETVSASYDNGFERIGHGLVIRTVYRLRLDSPAAAASGFRPLMDRAFAQPLLSFGPGASVPKRSGQVLSSALNFPWNAHIANLDARGNGSVVLRLTNPFAVGEGPMATTVTVDLATVFPKAIVSVTETTLTANRPLADLHRLVWRTVDGVPMPDHPLREPIVASDPSGLTSVPVTLRPQEFRTFMITLQA